MKKGLSKSTPSSGKPVRRKRKYDEEFKRQALAMVRSGQTARSVAQAGNCKTVNDNPEHPACEGGCTDSEGNPHLCMMEGRIGPPKDPYMIKLYLGKSKP